MKIYLISYDLSKPEQDYEGLISEIEKFDSLHIQKSVWLVDSNFESQEIYSMLKQFVDKNDKLFICPLDLYSVAFHTDNEQIKEWFSVHGYRLGTLK